MSYTRRSLSSGSHSPIILLPTPPNVLQLKTFGGLWLAGGEPSSSNHEGLRRHLVLLALVAEAGERGVSRDRVIGLYWPDGEEERGRRSLNQLRYTLRQKLGVDPLIGTRTLRADPANLTSDVADFSAAIAAGDVDRADTLYAGPFLEGVFGEGGAELDSLIEERRAALKRQLEQALLSAARDASNRNEPEVALRYHRRLGGLDPLSAPFALGLMTALAQGGDASGALVAAAEHEAIVRRELESAPDASITALVLEIRGRLAASQTSTQRPEPLVIPESVTAPTVSQSPAYLPETKLSPPRRRWPLIAVSCLAILLIAAVAAARLAPNTIAALVTLVRRPDATLVPQRVAVAPLINQTGDSTLDALGAMAADWIAQGLGETGTFDVVDPRTASIANEVVGRIPRVLRAGDRAVALGRETGAAISVGGALYRDGDSIRAVLRVVNTETGQVLRPIPPVAGVASNPGAMITTLTRLSVAAVAAVVDSTSPELSARLSPPPSYEAYVETRRAWESYYRTDLDESLSRLSKAIALDTTYAPPLLLKIYVLEQSQRWSEADSGIQLLRRRALRLTPVEQAAFDVMQADVVGDLNARLLASRELARLAPASTEAATLVAGSAVRLGRNREALQALSGVDPERGLLLFLPAYWTMTAEALHNLGQFDEEVAAVRRGLRQFPAEYDLQAYLIGALAAKGDVDGALREARRPVANEPFPAHQAANLTTVAAMELRGHGHEQAAQAILDSLADHLPIMSTDTSHQWHERVLHAEILYQAGRWAAADSALRPYSLNRDLGLGTIGRIATIDARLGRRSEAERISRELGSRPLGYLHGRHTAWRAHIAAVLGDREAAVLLLRDAFAQGYSIIEGGDVEPQTDRDFLELLNDPAFRGVMQRE